MSQVVRRFRLALEARDSDAAIEALADDVVFRSPVVFKPYRGRAEVKPIPDAAFCVLHEWRCVREIGAPDG